MAQILNMDIQTLEKIQKAMSLAEIKTTIQNHSEKYSSEKAYF